MVADDGSKEGSAWPVPKFYFVVNFGNETQNATFQEVSGLETETQTIEYRHSNSPLFSTVKMPGIAKYGNVILKRGVFVKDNNFWKWLEQIKMNTIKRQTVVIKLLDESGSPAMTWTLANAWPTKITSTDLKSEGHEVALESLELAHEGLTIANNQ
jgi:phage tail-like protein